MIDCRHLVPLTKQAKLLCPSGGSLYYQLDPTSECGLRRMRKIDQLNAKLPFAGARMLRHLLQLDGKKVGRKHVSILMDKMGIEALYRKINSSKKRLGSKSYLYLLRGEDRPAGSNMVFACDLHSAS